jgi:hypothetical protein
MGRRLTVLGGITLLCAVLVGSGASVAQSPSAGGSPDAGAASVIAWNDIALNAAVGVAKQPPPHAIITIALVQAAVYDAAVSILGGYQPYLAGLEAAPGASVEAAVATAAHGVLVHYLPEQQADLDAALATALGAIADGDAKTAGTAVGQAAAAALIAARKDDGYAAATDFVMPEPGPGVWQIPEDQKPIGPWIADYTPFLMESDDQFRPGPPPALDSPEWAADLNEVKEWGGAESTVRTPEQGLIAQFWSTQPTIQINKGYQKLAADRGLDALETARLFAMTSLVSADAITACFDAKYHYLAWRPFTAVAGADTDGNDATVADPAWKPLIGTPPHPEYPSAHSCVTPAAGAVLTAFLGTDQIDLTLGSSVTADTMPTRHFATAQDLADEVIEARILGGIHYRTSDVVGAELGRTVAGWALERYFQPVS